MRTDDEVLAKVKELATDPTTRDVALSGIAWWRCATAGAERPRDADLLALRQRAARELRLGNSPACAGFNFCGNEGWQYHCDAPNTCPDTQTFSPGQGGLRGEQCESFTCQVNYACNAQFDHICDLKFECTQAFNCNSSHIFQCVVEFDCKGNFTGTNTGTACTSTAPYRLPLPNGSTDTTPGDTVCGAHADGTTLGKFNCTTRFTCATAHLASSFYCFKVFNCVAGTKFNCSPPSEYVELS